MGMLFYKARSLEREAHANLAVPTRRDVGLGRVAVVVVGEDGLAGSVAVVNDLVHVDRRYVVDVAVAGTPFLVEHVGEVHYVERQSSYLQLIITQ